MRDRVDASVAVPRSRRMARLLIVVLALVWTQFPFSGGGASAEGGHELASDGADGVPSADDIR